MRDFNNIKPWLISHLDRLGWSVETFAEKCDLSRTAVYFFMEDTNRPGVESMAKMCKVLQVPLEEGLRQYTPKKVGRPAGWRKPR